jgi:hypothetical protein
MTTHESNLRRENLTSLLTQASNRAHQANLLHDTEAIHIAYRTIHNLLLDALIVCSPLAWRSPTGYTLNPHGPLRKEPNPTPAPPKTKKETQQ